MKPAKLKKLFLTLIAPLAISACVMGAQTPQMVTMLNANEFPSNLHSNIEVSTVIGGQKTVLEGEPRISNENFKGAIEDSLKSSGLYSTSGEYKLDIEIKDLIIPLAFTTMTVQTEPTIQYTITRKSDNVVTFNKTIKTHYATAIHDGGFIGSAYINRLRRTLELSAQKNISKFLQELSNYN